MVSFQGLLRFVVGAGRAGRRLGRVLEFVCWDLDNGGAGQGQWKPRDPRTGMLGLRVGIPEAETVPGQMVCVDSLGKSPGWGWSRSQAPLVLARVAVSSSIRLL